MDRPIYLDYQATTPVDRRVVDVVLYYMTTGFGNASSVDHTYGDEASEAVATAIQHVKTGLGAEGYNIVFTSGATESINLAIGGFARVFNRTHGTGRCRIGLTGAEHPAVLGTCQKLQDVGAAHLTFFNVDIDAQIDLEDLERKLQRGLDLVCVMAANNELGTIYPLQEIASLARRHGARFFSDATQAVGKTHLNVDMFGIDAVALSAHKLHGPKGIGALVLSPAYPVEPLFGGGGQQRGLRPGTVNVPGIAGLGEAMRLSHQERIADEAHTRRLRDSLQSQLTAAVPGLHVNGCQSARLPGALHVSIPGVPNHAVVARLRDRVALSTGAACSSGIERPSHVLEAANLPRAFQESALRLSLGKFSTQAEMDASASIVANAIEETRRVLGAAPLTASA